MDSPADRCQTELDFYAAEAHLKDLQQQYRRAEAAHRAHVKKTQGLISKDEQEIRRLEDEREKVLHRRRESQRFKRRADARIAQDLTAALACRDRTDEELEAEKAKVASLKNQILEWERKVAKPKQKTGGGTARSLKENIRQVQNKLDKSRQRCDMTMRRNGELREELKVLEMKKKRFLHAKSGLEKKLRVSPKKMRNVMTECTKAFEAREAIREEEKMLMDQNAQDVAQFTRQRIGLEQEISHCRRSELFLDMKAVARSIQDIEHGKVEPKQVEELGAEDLEDAVKKILAETGESDLDTLLGNFIQMEGQSHTLLKLVSDQHNEAESMRRQISQLWDEIDILQQEQDQVLLEEVSIKREEVDQQLADYEQRVERLEKIFHQLQKGVESLLQISSVTCDQLDFPDGVQDEYITECLRRVGSRVSELLAVQSFLRFKESPDQWESSSAPGQLLGLTPPRISLTTPAASPPSIDLDEVVGAAGGIDISE